ncbi:MAG TPA: hypothetical protein VM582_00340 [Candidatus Thermoplasmatota archaeon]|nr:hypothetical protein [Candidatus Thermoplasmatota archaeon]
MDAVAVPKPGYLHVRNDAIPTNGGCSGDPYLQYRMLTVDTSFALRVERLANCTALVQHQEIGESFSYVGGALARLVLPTGLSVDVAYANTTWVWIMGRSNLVLTVRKARQALRAACGITQRGR